VEWAAGPIDEEFVGEVEAVLAPVLNTSWRTGRLENNEIELADAPDAVHRAAMAHD